MVNPIPTRVRRFLVCLADGRDCAEALGVSDDSDSMARVCLVALCRGLIGSDGGITIAGLAAIGRAQAETSRAIH